MSIQKTPLEHLKQDLNLLYAGMLGLSAAQKELLDELIDQYKDEERNGIENAFFQGGNNTTCVILNKQQGKYANSIDYFTQTYGTPAEVEQAIRLKAVGFDIPVRWMYHPHYGLYENNEPNNFNGNNWIEGYYSAPTLDETCNWLRESKGMHVYAKPYPVTEKTIGWERNIVCVNTGKFLYHEGYHYTHERALSAAIDHALTILEKEVGNG